MKAENEQLLSRLQQLEKCMNEGTDEKKKYMEGAVWMGKKMSTEVERVCQSFEFLLVEYKQRLQGAPGSEGHQLEGEAQRREYASCWLVEAVKQAGFDLYEKVITILESAVYHMEDAKHTLQAKKQAQSSERPDPFQTDNRP